MAFVEMGSFHHYQPPNAGLRRDGRPTASNLRVSTARGKGNNPTALGPGKKWSGILQDHDLIETLDMTALPPDESLDPFHVPAPNLNGTEREAEGTVFRRCI